MPEPAGDFSELSHLDKLVHEPARLALLTALNACREADFTFLQRLTGLTQGNLGSHLGRLEAAGLVDVTRTFVGRHPRTLVQLTERGRETLDAHWRTLERFGRLRNGAVR